MAEVGHRGQLRKVAQAKTIQAQAVHVLVVCPGDMGRALAPAALDQPGCLVAVFGVIVHGVRQRHITGRGIDPRLQACQQRPSLALAFTQDMQRLDSPLHQTVKVFNDLLIIEVGVDHAHTALQLPGVGTRRHPAQGIAHLPVSQDNRGLETRLDRLHAQHLS